MYENDVKASEIASMILSKIASMKVSEIANIKLSETVSASFWAFQFEFAR